MKNLSKKKYSSAKRLTDEEILFLAADEVTPVDEAKPQKNNSRKRKFGTEATTSAKRKPGRPPKIKKEESIVDKTSDSKKINANNAKNADKPIAVVSNDSAEKNIPSEKVSLQKDIKNISHSIEIKLKRRPGRPPKKHIQTDLHVTSPMVKEESETANLPIETKKAITETSKPAKGRPGRPKKNVGKPQDNKARQAKETQTVISPNPVDDEKKLPLSGTPEKRSENLRASEQATLQESRKKTFSTDESSEKGSELSKPEGLENAKNVVPSSEVANKEQPHTRKKRGGRPKKTTLLPIVIDENEPTGEASDGIPSEQIKHEKSVSSEGIEGEKANREIDKTEPTDGEQDDAKDKEIPESEESILDKVRKSKKRRGKKTKKNQFIVVTKDENNKPKPVSEEEKETASSSIKDAIVSKFNQEPATPPVRMKTIEPLVDLYTIAPEKLLTVEEKKNEFITKFLSDVEHFLIHEMYVDRSSKIVVAVSGGVDSIVLLDILALLSDKYKFSIFVAHYNHNLRGDSSDNDQQFVSDVAAAYNLPVYVAGGKVRTYAEKNAVSIEAAARFLRYSFLERTSRNLNSDFVATAHTSDDSAETFLMNLLRGAGLTGLSGIPFRRQFVKDVLLIRPFINFDKATLIKYAKLRKIKWHEDETNSLQGYTRNRVRHDLIPKLKNDYNPKIVEIINRTSKLMQGADRIIHGYVRNNLPNVLTDVQTDKFTIKLPIFQTFDRFIQGEMIQSALMKYLRVQLPSLKSIDRVVALQDSEIGAKCEVTKTITAIRDRNTIVFARKQYLKEINTVIDRIGKFKVSNITIVLKEVTRKQMEFSKNPNVEYFDMQSVPPALFLRTWQEGDVFKPLGMTGTMKITDFLTNEKVDFVDRQNVLVLAAQTEIIWILGKRISEKFKVKPESQSILKIEIRYNEK